MKSEEGAAPVFVISTGRSGSTLVQRLLNCHPDLVVWGEHFGFLGSAATALMQMQNPEQKHYPHTADSNRGWARVVPRLEDPAAALEWVNPWSAEEFAIQLRAFAEAYFGARLAPGQRWGFKEIRYNSVPMLRGLHQLWPQARFVFVRRDLVEVTRSKVFAFVKEQQWSALRPAQQRERLRAMLAEVRSHYHVYASFMTRVPAVGLMLDYETLLAEPQAETARVLVHLGLDPQRFDGELAARVMGSTITTTRRDDELLAQIGKVLAEMPA